MYLPSQDQLFLLTVIVVIVVLLHTCARVLLHNCVGVLLHNCVYALLQVEIMCNCAVSQCDSK